MTDKTDKKEKKRDIPEKEPKKKVSAISMLRLRQVEILEGLLGLALIVVINIFWFKDNLGFWGIRPHPYWIVILLIATRYGFLPGVFTAIAASLLLMIMLKVGYANIKWSVFLKVDFLSKPLLFLAGGIIIGEIREVYRRAYNQLSVKYNDLQELHQQLAESYQGLSRAKQEIDTWVVSREHTVSTLYEAAQGLKSLDEKDIYPAVLKLLLKFTEAESCSLYMLFKGKFILTEKNDIDTNSSFSRPKEVDSNIGQIGRVFTSKNTISLNRILSDQELMESKDYRPVVSAPLMDNHNRVLGIINIEKLPFIKFNPQTVRMTTLIADWCGSALENARVFKETHDKNIADDVTRAYTYQYCQFRLQEEFSRAKRYKFPSSLLAFEFDDYTSFSEQTRLDILTVFSLVLKNKLRTIDLLFHHKEINRFVLFLPNTPLEGANIVRKKVFDEIQAFNFKPYDDDRPLQVKVGAVSVEDSMKNYQEFIQKAFEAMK